MELVRYIHLNPLRAKIVADYKSLKGFRYAGHCALIGKCPNDLNLDHGVVTRRGRYPDTVEARSVLCYWAARELGISTLELSRKLGISQPTASQSVKRGEKIVNEKGFKLV